MQQRQPRLGDIVDDYCPRERRITNHAVVAMVGDAVKQTRCTTCDADHEYKHAKVPPQRRKKEEGGVLYQQVLAGMPRKAPGIPVAGEPDDASDLPPDPPVSDEPQLRTRCRAGRGCRGQYGYSRRIGAPAADPRDAAPAHRRTAAAP